jgi:hypothetical protein
MIKINLTEAYLPLWIARAAHITGVNFKLRPHRQILPVWMQKSMGYEQPTGTICLTPTKPPSLDLFLGCRGKDEASK